MTSPKEKSSERKLASPIESINIDKSSEYTPTSFAQKPFDKPAAPVPIKRFLKLSARKSIHPILPKPQSNNPSSQSNIESVQVFKEPYEVKSPYDSANSISSSTKGDESLKFQLRRSGRYGLKTKVAKPSESGSKDKPMNI